MTAAALLWTLAWAGSASPSGECSVRPVALRCEALVEPLAVQTRRPQLSFRLEPTDPGARGQGLVAWQVQVASSDSALESDAPDRWESGRVESSDTTAIEYAGEPLGEAERCVWRARVWDEGQRESEWSAVASFTTGIDDWSAEWIGWDAPLADASRPPTLEGAEWIGHPDDEPERSPAEDRFYRHAFDLPGALPTSALLAVTADNVLELHLNGAPLELDREAARQWRVVEVLDLTERLQPGTNVLAARVRNLGASPAGLIARLVLASGTGESRELASGAGWSVSREPGRGWSGTDDRPDAGWVPARTIGAYPCDPWGRLQDGGLFLPPPRRLRGALTIEKPVRRALLYSTALGIHDVYLDEERVNDSWFEPGWTDYRKRVHYRAWDVGGRLGVGQHVLAAELADGWYAGYVGYGGRREHYGARPRVLCQLLVDYQDGTRELFGSGPHWRASTGPLLEADFLMGERRDARLEADGWAQPGFDDSGWAVPERGAEHAPRVEAHPGPPVRTFAELVPLSERELERGTWIFDLGQNFAGVVRLRLRGEAGDEIRLRHAERLDPEGRLYTDNLRAARATDVYVCRGGGEEVFEPRFTFHGFQYVEVSGLRGQPRPGDVVGLALSSDTPDVGSFECSDERVNRLVRNARWTQRANFIDVPTDCPQRDERLGWTGDAQVYLRTAAYLCDVQAFFRKWLQDLEDAQRADGQFPMVAPLAVAGDDGGPAWADAGVFCPWDVWQVYGNERDLAARFESMKRFVDFCRGRAGEDLQPPEEFHCFGDWLHVDDETPKGVIHTAYLAASSARLARAAAELGREADAREYAALAEQAREAFREHHVDELGLGLVNGDSQTAYVLALAFDLLPDELGERAARHLLSKLEGRAWHLSTGFVGTKDLMGALAKIGRNDVAYRLLENDSYPSWLFALEHGATSIWERWDGWTPERGFADAGMNSFAHYAFGAVVQWIFENVGGIRPARPGFARVDLRPQPGGGLSWARTRYESIRGPIETAWRLNDGRLELDASLPPGVSGDLHLPTSDPASVSEGGRPALRSPGVTQAPAHAALLQLEPGSYRFVIPKPLLQQLDAPR